MNPIKPIQAPQKLINMIRSDEGFINRLYVDSEGFRTIGIGFCLDKAALPEPVAFYWCGFILDGLRERINNNQSIGQTYKQLSEPRQWAVINMAYQMGVSGLCGFLNMWDALDRGDYEKAAEEALDSVWARQTKKRAGRIAEILRTGVIKGYRL